MYSLNYQQTQGALTAKVLHRQGVENLIGALQGRLGQLLSALLDFCGKRAQALLFRKTCWLGHIIVTLSVLGL